MDNFVAAQYAARLVAMGDAARCFLGQCAEDEPEVVSLRVTVTYQSGGLSVVEWELIQAQGMAVGGGTA